MKKFYTITLSILMLFSATACGKPSKPKSSTSTAPATHELATLVKSHPDWMRAARKTEAKWGVPVNVQLAIMHTESHFKSNAKNPHSTALGFAQAINGTWSAYQRQTGHSGSRTSFASSSDFIGWYAHQASQQLGISKENAYNMYIAYHDGLGAYKSSVKRRNSRISRLALTVQKTAVAYDQVLNSLEV